MPSLQRLIISNTILTQSVKGDPPLLKEHLTQRYGMAIQRQATEPPKKTPIVIQHPVIIQEFEPKIKKSTVDQRYKTTALKLLLTLINQDKSLQSRISDQAPRKTSNSRVRSRFL